MEKASDSVTVRWPDETDRHWTATFALDDKKSLIQSISVDGKPVLTESAPLYRCSTGTRRGGWDQFFDFPPSHPQGTHDYQGDFHLLGAKVESRGDRIQLTFDGLKMGVFTGAVRYTIYPGTRLLQQEAVVSTSEPDVAYYYDAGLRMSARWASRAGNNMEASISYYDTAGKFQTVPSSGPERIPVQVRYRTLAVPGSSGSIAVFPAPHRYFFARDYTTNLGYLWHVSWRGNISTGIRQLPDDNSPFYPWMNAPPGTEQHMGVFYLLSASSPRQTIDEVLRYTNRDQFERLDGFKAFTPHWHVAYTVQAMEKGMDWIPPFKPVLKDMGVDAAMIMDFHGDGHPQDLTGLRLKELDAFFKATRGQSGKDFLLMPAEEANVHLGGHWAVSFPKPVFWMMGRPAGTEYRSTDPAYGPVYRVGNADEMLRLIRDENGFAYQTHPRTKGSMGFPDKIRETAPFQDAHYFGAGWKAMPSDLSTPRLGERSFKTLDDMNNWGLRKRLMAEADIFQIDSTHELYSHMNINYVRLPSLPDYDHYGRLLDAVRRGDFFMSTGEVLMPEWSIAAGEGDQIVARLRVRHRFPLEMGEVVWGDGHETYRRMFNFDETRQFGDQTLEWKVDAKNWKWARVALWDIAANGAFANPVWRDDLALTHKTVAVDGWHNRESQPHYRWEGTYMGGFSEVGRMLNHMGAATRTIETRFTASALQGIDSLIIADPDTPAETPNPNYIENDEIAVLAEWVRNGGRLLLLGNDKGNAEFAHFNNLARKFGFEFTETTYQDAAGSGKLTLTGDPKSTLFAGGLKFYAKDVAPIRVLGRDVKVLLAERETPIIVTARLGKGMVFALGDPWFYNEYLDTADNRAIVDNLFRSFLWAAGKSQ